MRGGVLGERLEVREEGGNELLEQGRVVGKLNWDGEGAATFGEVVLGFGSEGYLKWKRRSLEEIVTTAVEGGVSAFEGVGR